LRAVKILFSPDSGEKRPTGDPCPECQKVAICELCRRDIEGCVATVEGRLCPLPAHLLAAIPRRSVLRLSIKY